VGEGGRGTHIRYMGTGTYRQVRTIIAFHISITPSTPLEENAVFSNLRLCKSAINERVGERTLPNSPKTQNCNLAVYKLGVLTGHGGLVGGSPIVVKQEQFHFLVLTQA
jgi:hypothetical protein